MSKAQRYTSKVNGLFVTMKSLFNWSSNHTSPVIEIPNAKIVLFRTKDMTMPLRQNKFIKQGAITEHIIRKIKN